MKYCKLSDMVFYSNGIPYLDSWDLAEELNYRHDYLIYAVKRYVLPVSADDAIIYETCGIPTALFTPAAINTLADNHILTREQADNILYMMAVKKD